MRSKKRSRTPPKDLCIAIVGSGLAGLSTAIALEQQGFCNVQMYERDSCQSPRTGYGLTLTYHPHGTLQKLGVLEELALRDCPSRSHYTFDANGRIQGYFGNAWRKHRGYGQRGNLRVPRHEVRQVLLERLQHTILHYDHIVQKVEARPNGMTLSFENGTTVDADVVVAADGIWSSVVASCLPSAPPPRSLGIRLVLGITEHFEHPLVHERGFYTLDHGHRLFVMPFQGRTPDEPKRFMWQLSFASSDGASYKGEQLKEQVLQRVQGWHAPVEDMIQSTPNESIWGTLLHDRQPEELHKEWVKHCPRLLIVGDAYHAMSPFKGQGANQALTDGLTVGYKLAHSPFPSSLKVCMQEIMQRTRPVVEASRRMAQFWHSLDAFEPHLAGVPDELVPRALTALEHAGVTAECEFLDKRVESVLRREQYLRDDEPEPTPDPQLVDEARAAARAGDLATLRKISFRQANVLHDGCLHEASKAGHVHVMTWLVREAGCSVDQTNDKDESAMDVAANENVRLVLQQAIR